jgi:hypothetical protein
MAEHELAIRSTWIYTYVIKLAHEKENEVKLACDLTGSGSSVAAIASR